MDGRTCAIKRMDVNAYVIPTDSPEADGTLEWNSTTLIVVELFAGGKSGLGYTYAGTATAVCIREVLTDAIVGFDAMAVPARHAAMMRIIRNLGQCGIATMAVAAVDCALWDLKARLLDIPLVQLLGQARESIAVYGSGGFTSYSREQLQSQLRGWVEQGIRRVKMKIGTHPEHDVARVQQARQAIGPDTELFVDANGAYGRSQSLKMAAEFAALGVTWFEEPVPSSDLDGLRFIRERVPPGMEIAAGEYGYDLVYFRNMLAKGAVGVLQADASRCAGISGFMGASVLSQSFLTPLSAHCAPSLHVHPCCASQPAIHLEYFHDHSRIEHMLFDGCLTPKNGTLTPDLSRPGMGLELKHADAKRYQV